MYEVQQRPLDRLSLDATVRIPDLGLLDIAYRFSVTNLSINVVLNTAASIGDVIFAISRISSLTHLHICFDFGSFKGDYDPIMPIQPMSKAIFFGDNLRYLSLKGYSSHISAFFQSIERPTSATEMALQFSYDYEIDPILEMALQERCVLNMVEYAPHAETCFIRHNNFWGEQGFSWGTLQHIKHWKFLKSLSVCLRSICIESEIGHNLAARATSALWWFRGWDTLVHLNFYTYNVWMNQPCTREFHTELTPLDFLDIALCCPNLQSLEISIQFPMTDTVIGKLTEDCNKIHTLSLSNDMAHHHGLKKLEFYKISSPGSVLEQDTTEFNLQMYSSDYNHILPSYLQLVFPCLDMLKFTPWDLKSHLRVLNWCRYMEDIMGDFKNRIPVL